MPRHETAASVTVTIRHRFLFVGLRHNQDPYVETAEYRARLQLKDALKGWLLTPHEPSKSAPHDYILAVTVCLDDPDAERIASVQATLRGLFEVSASLPELLLFDPRAPRAPRTTVIAETADGEEFVDKVEEFIEGVVGRENVTRNPVIGPDGMVISGPRPEPSGAGLPDENEAIGD